MALSSERGRWELLHALYAFDNYNMSLSQEIGKGELIYAFDNYNMSLSQEIREGELMKGAFDPAFEPNEWK